MKLLVVDGTNAVMRRASVATELTPPLVAADVTPRILRAAEHIRATHLVVAFDSSTSIRRTADATYKADRTVDTSPYASALLRLLKAQDIHCVGVPGYEADDIIATIARRSPGRVATLSSDNDLLVLAEVAEVWQYAPKGSDTWLVRRDAEWVHGKFGVDPRQYPDYLALVGGKNGVPGFPGIGAKRAAKLLQTGALTDDHRVHIASARKLLDLYDVDQLSSIDPTRCRVRQPA